MRGLRMALLAGLLIAALALAACGGDDEEGEATATEPAPAAEGTTVNVEAGEYYFTPDPASAPAGDITFTANNVGAEEHELIVYLSDEDPGALPVEGDLAVLDEDAELGEIEPEDLQPGAAGSMTLTLEAGSYILLCNIEGHYGQGMYAGFTVE
jgi:uncharacterized cupredoxin-like copper-binding protein